MLSRVTINDPTGVLHRPLPVVAGAYAGGTALGAGAALATRALGMAGIPRTVLSVGAGLLGATAGAFLANRFISRDAQHAPPADDELRVATVNIHMAVPKGFSLGDARESDAALRDLARYVNALDADIVFVQEVDDDVPDGSGGVPRQLSRLGDLLHATDVAYAPSMPHDQPDTIDRYGIAIYTRNGITLDDVQRTTLPYTPGMEARQMLAGEAVLADGSRITVVDTHLDHSGVDRPQQLKALADAMARIDGPVIVGGDFNATASEADALLHRAGVFNVMSSAFVQSLPDSPARDAALAASYMDRRIDHIYTSPDVLVRDVWSEEIPMHDLVFGVAVSDHRPVVADVSVPSR